MEFRCHVCYRFWSCQRIPKIISRLLTLQLETAVEIHVWRVFSIQMLHCLTGVRHVWSDPSQLLGGTLLTSNVFNVLLHFVFGKMLTTRPFREKIHQRKIYSKNITWLWRHQFDLNFRISPSSQNFFVPRDFPRPQMYSKVCSVSFTNVKAPSKAIRFTCNFSIEEMFTFILPSKEICVPFLVVLVDVYTPIMGIICFFQ